ncbi:MAG: DUF2442 domain-containing protein [Deltaproteobacteria bacterium]|nr:MAG: DUF2442 domain-containing protein [Deltaproteobacteria bacterium]
MNSSQPGTSISAGEVTNIEPLGFWILVENKEYFVPFDDYPVFKNASIQQIFQMQRLSDTQLYWPDLDADIEIEALEQPEHYPLVFK